MNRLKKEVRSEKEFLIKEPLLFFFLEISIQVHKGILLGVQKPKILVKLILQLHLLTLTILLEHPLLTLLYLLVVLKDLFLDLHPAGSQPHLLELLDDF